MTDFKRSARVGSVGPTMLGTRAKPGEPQLAMINHKDQPITLDTGAKPAGMRASPTEVKEIGPNKEIIDYCLRFGLSVSHIRRATLDELIFFLLTRWPWSESLPAIITESYSAPTLKAIMRAATDLDLINRPAQEAFEKMTQRGGLAWPLRLPVDVYLSYFQALKKPNVADMLTANQAVRTFFPGPTNLKSWRPIRLYALAITISEQGLDKGLMDIETLINHPG